MAFPQIQGTAGTGGGAEPGSITLPAGIVTGERLLALVAFDSLSTDTTISLTHTGTGWVKLAELRAAGSVVTGVFEKREATGSDALTVGVDGNSVGEIGNWIVYRISGHDPAQAAEIAGEIGTGSDANIDAPNLVASWGSADNLWVWAAGWDNATRTLTSYPANYTANQVTNVGSASSASVGVAMATRALTSASENPGIATISSADQWTAFTIAIKGTGTSGPSISDQPDNTTVAAGSTASFTAAYTGSIDGFQWQQSADGGGTWGSVPDGTGASGGAGTGGSLTYTTTATAVSTGNHRSGYGYRVRLNPSGTPVDSAAAILTVTAPPSGPTINTQPANQTVTQPGAATFSVVATASAGTLSYQWQRNPGGVGSWADVTTGSGGTTASYTTGATSVTGGTDNNGDQYRCLVSDTNGTTTTSAATLTVNSTAITNNIRLQPSIRLERGAYAASRTMNRWWVLSADLTAVVHTGTNATFDASGRPTIDINGAQYDVGDVVPMWFGEWDAVTPLDRTVRSGLMWVPAIAQS